MSSDRTGESAIHRGLREKPITRENLNEYLKELAKEFRRLNGVKTPAEIILIGGAAALANYGFREMTYDIDAVINASSAMKDAINRVGDKYGLPHGWFNSDFQRTASYSDKLGEISVYYKTYSNVLQIRTITAEYLIAMKLVSGRRYKNDLSDVAGILLEHKRRGAPIERAAIEAAIQKLYGAVTLPETSAQLLDMAFTGGDYEKLYNESCENEKLIKDILVEFEHDYPATLTGENVNAIIERAKQKRAAAQRKDNSV